MKESIDYNTNLIDEQDNKQDNKQDNNIKNIDEKEPFKKSKDIKSILKHIEKGLNEEDDDKEDEKEEYPIKVELEGNQGQITIIKTQLQTCWAHNYDNKIDRILIKTFFYLFLPFLTSINLIGIFQIISVMNALYKALIGSIWCYFDWEDKEDKSYYDFYNFYSFYFKESINEGIEFDLIETMSFLGMIFYNFYGYKISSILFMIPNVLSFFLIYMLFSQYNDNSDKYNLFQILYLFSSWALLFIGVGSSALLSQQMLIDNYGDYISFLKQINFEDYQNNEDDQDNNFIFICVTSIIGALIKYIFDIIISRKKYKFDQKYNIIDFNDINSNIKNNNNTSNEINNIIYSHDKLLFFVSIICIYGGTIILSIIFKNNRWT